jgi:hypothetical protein
MMKVLGSVASRVVSLVVQQFSVTRALLLCLLVLGISSQAFGQNATVVGTVTDPSGAAVANATLTITHTETGQAYHLTSNGDGQYVAPDLPIGHYNVKVEAPGFKVAEQKNVVLQVGDRTRLDFQMVVGGASETVTVEANEVRVQTDSGELSNVITDQQVSQLAVNGRSIYQLAQLTRVRHSTLELIEETRARDLRVYRWQHPFIGSLNAYQWFALLGLHQIRHEKQIREIAAHLSQAALNPKR